eukprot:TRINITY_DN2242_c0_g1_i1.p1 TRINITY_DN2242_c0_g1~~TRINITY_DN2242_c0_g1_i1.p1  ORF type:complete len:350 (-),score=30.98 TRINITY_DN2242_c0_g1_i1:156-1205(-)
MHKQSLAFYSNVYGIQLAQDPVDVPRQEQIEFDDDYFTSIEKAKYEFPKPMPRPGGQQGVPFKWQQGGLLGCGSFGRVYLGLNLETGDLLAIKQVQFAEGQDLTQNTCLQALMQEISILQSLKHENIVQYLGSTIIGYSFNIFLEYVAGGSIASLIDRFGPIKENLTRLYTRQILSGLDYIHRRQIVHCDIKGANILIDNKGVIKLTDFGASKSLESVTAHKGFNSLRGTVYWMAPEVIRQSGYGRKADIWSLGCTVIEMITGRPPWINQYTETASALFNIAMSNQPPSLPPTISPHTRDFILQCMRRDPAHRPNTRQLGYHPLICSSPLPSPDLYETPPPPFPESNRP